MLNGTHKFYSWDWFLVQLRRVICVKCFKWLRFILGSMSSILRDLSILKGCYLHLKLVENVCFEFWSHRHDTWFTVDAFSRLYSGSVSFSVKIYLCIPGKNIILILYKPFKFSLSIPSRYPSINDLLQNVQWNKYIWCACFKIAAFNAGI